MTDLAAAKEKKIAAGENFRENYEMCFCLIGQSQDSSFYKILKYISSKLERKAFLLLVLPEGLGI